MAGTTDIIFSFAGDTLFETYEKNKFFEKANKMPTIPLPRKNDGPKSFKNVVTYINDNYVQQKAHDDPENISVIKNAINQLKLSSVYKEDNYKTKQQLLTMIALLQLNIGEYEEASATTKGIIDEFQKLEAANDPKFTNKDYKSYPFSRAKTKCSLPLSIWGISSLSDPNVDVNKTTHAIMDTINIESKNKMLPLIISIYLDRLLLRQDKIRSEDFIEISSSISDIKDANMATQCYQIILTRSIIMAKRYQDFLFTVKKTPKKFFRDKNELMDKCKFVIAEYGNYNKVSGLCLTQINKNNSFMKKEENRKVVNDLTVAFSKYQSTHEQLNKEYQD
jgi:hypothetical protein